MEKGVAYIDVSELEKKMSDRESLGQKFYFLFNYST